MTFSTRVSSAYAADGVGPAVYGRYRDNGYAVRPLLDALGTPIERNASASEAFSLAGLDWTAERRPLHYATATGDLRPATGRIALVRSDTEALLGVHGTSYTPIQHTALINVLDYLRESIKIENVLSLHQGRRVFATASFDCESEVTSGDKIRRYLHLFNSFDGSSSFGIFFSDMRLNCANQLAYLTGKAFANAEASGAGLRCRHTVSSEQFAQRLPALIDLERQQFSESLSDYQLMANTALTTDLARRILESTYADKLATPITDKSTKERRERTLDDLPEIATIRSHYSGTTGYATQSYRGTAFGLYNAITQFETHDAGRTRNETERARARLESLWGGTASKRLTRAKQACLAA